VNSRKDPIAIVGMGCVFPNAFNVEHYWQTLLEGKTSFMPVPKELWENSLFYSPDRREPDRYYDDVVSYPFGFKLPIDKFKCSPDILKNLCREEQYFITALNECFLDIRSQVQRTKLFVGHTSLADAINKWHLSQEIGRDFRSVLSDEKVLHRVQEVLDKGLLDHKDLAPEKVLTHERTSFLAGQILGGRVDLDLIDAACASSLFTLDLGIMELLKGTSDMVICGGMSYSAPFGKVLFCRLGGSSRSGVYPFQARADGTVFGDGSGFVALKKLSTALKDGDQIHALIPEIGTASDGKGKSIYAPSTSGQILAMDRAYKNSGISPASVQFIEAHGTGTAAGDATEFKSLQNFFEKNSVQKTSVGLGSVKALFGHLGWVAGTAALIKMVLCLKNKTIVAQPNFDSLNPALDLKNSALWIPQKNSPWPSDGREPRRAGINGFGFGGTNAHVILQEYIPASGNLSEISNKTSSECTAVSGADDFVIVGAGSYFPNLPNWQALCEKIENGENIEPSFHGGFKPNNIKFRVIDRSAAVIDPSQFLVLESGIQALAAVGDKWKELKAETGVFLSQASALGNQIAVTKRIYARFVKTALDADLELKQLSDIESATQKWVDATLETNPPPNEDSNPGIMPNVTAGRLCNYLDLQGPNFSINSGGQSLIRTFEIALSHLLFNKCEVALVGACHIAKFESYRDLWQRMAMTGPLDEGAVVFAVMKKEVAQRRGIKAWANISLLRVEDNRKPTPLVSPVLFSAPETGIMLKLLSKALKGEATRPLVTSESAQTQWQITVSPAAVVEESVPEFSLCGEVKFADAGQTEFHRTLTEESDAYLKHHLVKEKPTLPGTFMIETAAQAAKKLFPERVIHRISEIRFLKFIRPPIELRTRVTRHHDGDGREYLKITLLSDLISKKGQILQKDNLHFSCEVHWRDVQDTKPVPGPCKAEMSSLTSVVDSYHEIGMDRLGLFPHLKETVILARLNIFRWNIRFLANLKTLFYAHSFWTALYA
jgi:3-oxoacyl-(acyl-carrier-protein) synthase